MLTLYICFLAGGAVLPVTSFILGFINNLTDTDVDVDTDIDADTDLDLDMDADIDTDIDTDISPDLDGDADLDLNSDADVDTDMDMVVGSELIGSAFSLALYPTSLMSLSALAIVFGAIGSIMTLTGKGAVLSFIVAVISGYLASITVQTILKTLKRVQTRNSAINEKELMLYDGKVVDTILPGQMGSVSFVSLSNIRVNYPARCADESLKLSTGRAVKVKEIKNGIMIVEPKNKYE
jgi:hypothetical protein